jgi:hypothetical protein
VAEFGSLEVFVGLDFMREPGPVARF